jgi:hypothetical protein
MPNRSLAMCDRSFLVAVNLVLSYQPALTLTLAGLAWLGRRPDSKQFLFERKNQKTFHHKALR